MLTSTLLKNRLLTSKFVQMLCLAISIHFSTPLLTEGTKLAALQHKLLHDLFKDYDKDAHPGVNSTVVVTLGAKLARVVKVEEVDNVIKAQWWMSQSWYNPELRWNKTAYGNIDILFVEPSRIWVPDILLYNNGDERVEAAGGPEKFKTKISISNEGVAHWYAPTIFISMCKMDIRYFPFDEQICTLQFGSWSYDSSKIDLKVDEDQTRIHSDIYQENNEWKILALYAKKRQKFYSCCTVPFSDILVFLRMRRRSYHYMVNLVFPCAVISCMVFCTFFLPAESGERISLCITVLMAMTIFQELTSEKLPASSDGFILIEMYYTACIVLISLAIFVTCIVLNFYYRKSKMPKFIQRILLGWIARLFGVNTGTEFLKTNKIELNQVITNSVASEDSDKEDKNGVIALKSINRRKSSNIKEATVENHVNGALENQSVRNIENKNVVQIPKETTFESNRESDLWRQASQVLDRVSMLVGIIVALVSTAFIFLQAPRVKNIITGKESL